MRKFEIAGRNIGIEHDPLVIVEIGINHEGSLSVAKAMVDAAISAGAEVIKHQTHVVQDEMTDHAKKVVPGNAKESIYEIMDRCALNEQDEGALKAYVEEQGAIFISTPFSRAAVDRLERLAVKAYKIGSGECNNYPLVKYVASKGKPIILSTGMNTIESIKKSVDIMRDAKIPYALLHCTNVYPTPSELIRLGAIQELAEAFPDAVVGLSDHSVSNLACLGAVVVGASILERHFTDDKSRPGPDIECSMDPTDLAELIKGAIEISKMRGGRKAVLKEEEVTVKFAYASVVTISDIDKGEILTEENLWVKRPGTGDFGPEDYENLLGKRVIRKLSAGEQLKQDDVLFEN